MKKYLLHLSVFSFVLFAAFEQSAAQIVTQLFTTSGTFTVPPCVTSVQVQRDISEVHQPSCCLEGGAEVTTVRRFSVNRDVAAFFRPTFFPDAHSTDCLRGSPVLFGLGHLESIPATRRSCICGQTSASRARQGSKSGWVTAPVGECGKIKLEIRNYECARSRISRHVLFTLKRTATCLSYSLIL